jgi:hypothetical protein
VPEHAPGGPHDPPPPHHQPDSGEHPAGSGEHPSGHDDPASSDHPGAGHDKDHPTGQEDGTPDQLPDDTGDLPDQPDRPEFTLEDPLSQMSPELREMSEAHLSGNGETVLGPFRPGGGGPSYIAVAEDLNASYFSLGDEWDRFSPIEQVAANQHVLDVAIANGDTIRLSADFDRIPADSYTAAEIRYLEAHGYTREGNILHPPPRGR